LANIVVPANETWEVYEINLQIWCEATVAARGLQIEAYNLPTLLPTHPGGIFNILTAAVAWTANQYGGIHMSNTGQVSHYTNINNVVAMIANENPLPQRYMGTSVFTALCTNLQALDELCLTVWYRNVA